jgi:hypothetical protein
MEFSMQQGDALNGTFHLPLHENNITMITRLRSVLYVRVINRVGGL